VRSGSHGQGQPPQQGDGNADRAPNEGRTIAPPVRHEAADERSDCDRAVVRRRIPREGLTRPTRGGRVTDQGECAGRERRHAEACEPVDRHERKLAFDERQE